MPIYNCSMCLNTAYVPFLPCALVELSTFSFVALVFWVHYFDCVQRAVGVDQTVQVQLVWEAAVARCCVGHWCTQGCFGKAGLQQLACMI